MRVAGLVLIDTLKAGDIVRIHGKHTDFVQRATSMQFNHQHVNEAYAGQEIGLLVDFRARMGDKVTGWPVPMPRRWCRTSAAICAAASWSVTVQPLVE